MKETTPDTALEHSKLSKRLQGALQKHDISAIVGVNKMVPKPKIFSLRLSESEHKTMMDLVAEVNKYAEFKKISANDLLRALLLSATKTAPEKLFKLTKEL